MGRSRGESPATPASTTTAIDRGKLRAALRRLGDEYVYYKLLADEDLARIAAKYMSLDRVRPDGAAQPGLLAQVRAFDAAARAGRYYEAFNVNSSNFTALSGGTRAFIADCHRLLDRCVAEVEAGDVAEIRQCIEIVMGLLRYIDECNDDVVFFADEAGAWQVEVNWASVLPAWFKCLSRTATADEYASLVVSAIDEFDSPDRRRQLEAARQAATPAQREALEAASRRRPSTRR